MNIQELSKQYAKRPQVAALAKAIGKTGERRIFLSGLLASSAPLLFSSLAERCQSTILFILQDAEEAGYFYHDLTQLMGSNHVLFFPSSYRRSVKYAQRDPANEILRTEVLTAISEQLKERSGQSAALYVVSHPEAVGVFAAVAEHVENTAAQGILTRLIDIVHLAETEFLQCLLEG